jgi:hypothetical protein
MDKLVPANRADCQNYALDSSAGGSALLIHEQDTLIIPLSRAGSTVASSDVKPKPASAQKEG